MGAYSDTSLKKSVGPDNLIADLYIRTKLNLPVYLALMLSGLKCFD
mgnify:CR=1 FL=1